MYIHGNPFLYVKWGLPVRSLHGLVGVITKGVTITDRIQLVTR